jgi:hypothetical protein
MNLGNDEFISDLCDFHAANVNPNELSMSHTVFEEVVSLMTYCFVMSIQFVSPMVHYIVSCVFPMWSRVAPVCFAWAEPYTHAQTII